MNPTHGSSAIFWSNGDARLILRGRRLFPPQRKYAVVRREGREQCLFGVQGQGFAQRFIKLRRAWVFSGHLPFGAVAKLHNQKRIADKRPLVRGSDRQPNEVGQRSFLARPAGYSDRCVTQREDRRPSQLPPAKKTTNRPFARQASLAKEINDKDEQADKKAVATFCNPRNSSRQEKGDGNGADRHHDAQGERTGGRFASKIGRIKFSAAHPVSG